MPLVVASITREHIEEWLADVLRRRTPGHGQHVRAWVRQVKVPDPRHKQVYVLSKRARQEWQHAQRRLDANWSRFVPRAHHNRTPTLRDTPPHAWVVCICSGPNALLPMDTGPRPSLRELLDLD